MMISVNIPGDLMTTLLEFHGSSRHNGGYGRVSKAYPQAAPGQSERCSKVDYPGMKILT